MSLGLQSRGNLNSIQHATCSLSGGNWRWAVENIVWITYCSEYRYWRGNSRWLCQESDRCNWTLMWSSWWTGQDSKTVDKLVHAGVYHTSFYTDMMCCRLWSVVHSVKQILTYFHAAGHLAYAKSANIQAYYIPQHPSVFVDEQMRKTTNNALGNMLKSMAVTAHFWMSSRPDEYVYML